MSKRYEDEIHFKPENLKIITDESAHNLFENPIYHPIIQALRYRYLTINELEKEYNKIVKEEITKQFSNPKERKEKLSSASRKGQTLYRYLTHLKEKNLVIVGGTRIRMGQIAKELLYCTTAHSFFYKHDMEEMWNSKEFNSIIDKILDVSKQFEEIPSVSKDSLKEFIIHINNLREDRLLEIMQKTATDKSSIIDGLNVDQIRHFTETLSYLFLIINPELYEKELKKYIKK